MSKLSFATAELCYIDFDIDHHRRHFGNAAAFVRATDSRYGFSTSDIRLLEGSELSRVQGLLESDHEWSSKRDQIKIRPPPQGHRIVVRLFWDVAPLACENFATLCSNGSIPPGSTKVKPAPIGDCGKPLAYRGSKVHRVEKGFVVQAGDFVKENGSGGESIYGKKFKDERAGLSLKHDRRGLVSMGNSGKNSNTSQFFLTFDAAPACDGKHVIFGQVISGWAVLDAIEKTGSSSGEPCVPLVITDCGIWKHLEVPGSGYWYDKPDPESYTGISPLFVVRPRLAVVAPTETALSKFSSTLQKSCDLSLINAERADESSLVEKIRGLLDSCAIDGVILAPANRNIQDKLVLLSSAWKEISLEQVVLVAKPVDVAQVLKTKSWIHQRSRWIVDEATR